MVSVRAIVALVISPLLGGLLLQGCGGGGGGETTTTTTPGGGGGGDNPIPSIAEKNGDLSTLVVALKAADLVGTLSGKGPFTVFAPGNAAFKALPPSVLQYLLHEKAALTKVLEYHVASGSVLSSALKNGEQIKTLEGADVNVTITKKGNVATVMINDATVTTADVQATNGVVHLINRVLIPPGLSVPSIPAVATSAGLKTLVAAVGAAKLGDTLSGPGPFTVFAPTDDAFKALPKGVLDALLLPANIEDLKKVLEYHVVSGEVAAADLKNGEHVKTLEGQDVNVTISGSTVSINKAKVTQADVYAGNGIVHVINAVMLPPGFTPPTTPGPGGANPITSIAEKTGDLSTLVVALRAAGLVDTLSGKGPFTVFAPGNTAFKALPAPVLQYLLHDKAALTKVLEYHVASGSVLSSALKNGEQIKTLEGADVNVTITKQGNVATVMIDKATVTIADVKATNGVVHLINQVLIPPGLSVPSIPAVATAAGLKTLVAAVGAAKLGDTLSRPGPFTVFAPTDDAFKALPKGVLDALLLPENIKDLQKVLEYHVVAGEVAAADLKNGENVKTLEGQDVNITISGSTVSINKAKVTQADVYAGNGIVHVINAVMLPPGFTPPTTPAVTAAISLLIV